MHWYINFKSLLNKYGAFMALCLFCIAGCKPKDKPENKLPLITSFIADSVYLPITEDDDQVMWIQEVGRGRYAPKEYVAFVRKRNRKLYFYDIEAGHYLDSIPLAKYQNDYTDFYAESLDTVYVEQNNNTITRIANGIEKRYDVNPITQGIGKYVYIGYLSAYPLQVFGDTVICTTTTSESNNKVGPNLPFLDANYNIVFRLTGDTAQLLTKHHPYPDYFRQQDYYSNIEKAYLNSREIVYSYSHSDTLVLHNFFTGQDKRVKLKTDYFYPSKPFDYSRIMDYKYINDYEFEQSRLDLGYLFYSPGQNRIYQLMKHKGRYLEPDGRKNEYEDIPYSLFVLNEKLNQLKEIYIPPRTFYYRDYIFTTNKGIYFAAYQPKHKYHDKMLFYRIVVR